MWRRHEGTVQCPSCDAVIYSLSARLGLLTTQRQQIWYRPFFLLGYLLACLHFSPESLSDILNLK
jgi:hypothetical protein